MEAISRFMFALVVAVGIFSGQSVVALGMVAAPLFSLSVVPWAVRRSLKRSEDPERTRHRLPLRGGVRRGLVR